MKAMVLKAKNTPFALETVPDPTPGPGEAVARVLACGAGLTIHHTRAGRAPVSYPRIIGHEITAEIVAIGQGGLGMPDRDYYLKDDAKFADARAKYRTYVESMLELSGDAQASANAD